MVTLDKAVSNVNDEIKKANFNIKKLKHRNFNKKQITLYASVYAMSGKK
jgi:hypothetical protein